MLTWAGAGHFISLRRRVCCLAFCVSGNAIRALLRIIWRKNHRAAAVRDYLNLFRTRSYLINCIAHDLDDFCNGRFGFWVAGVFALSRSKSRTSV